MKKIIILLCILPFLSYGQIIITEPMTLTDNSPAEIIFNASEGNQGLMGFTGEVYAHTGVITDKSTNDTDWKYAPEWGDNNAKYKMTPMGNNRWKLDISPSIRSYYGVPASEEIIKLAFVFRSADNSKEGKGVGNTDIFVLLNEENFIPAEPVTRKRPYGIMDGINYIDDHTVTLLLFAPEKKHVHLMGDFNQWKKSNDYQLFKDGDYWWCTISGLEKGKEYGFQYLIDNEFKIADAYTEKILDPRYDREIPAATYPNIQPYPIQTEGIVSVFATGKQAYDWKTKNYQVVPKEELVIYELLIRDFTEAGNIQAVQDKLDYLQELGVNAIELMPIQEFDGNDSWGYNPCFYFAADKAYGTPDNYKAFIDEAHSRGIAVILDVVFNHATGQNPFARLYWEGNAPAADNPWFNREAPHPYNVFNDFNHEYKGTRDFFKRVLTYWIREYNIDGFRFDLTKGFTQKQSTEATAGNYDASRIAILKDYNNHIKSIKPNTYVILEHFAENREELELAQAGMLLWNNMNNAYSESIMGWKNEQNDISWGSYSKRGWDIPALVTYAESHDEERNMYKAKTYGNWTMPSDNMLRMKRAELASAFLFCTPGPKMIWQFGELGYDISIDENGRTGKKPVLWEYYDVPERKGLYETYSKLIKFRNQNPELFASPENITMQTTSSDWETGRAIRLQTENKDLVLIGNFIETAIDINPSFTSTGSWEEIFTGETITVTEGNKNNKITLQPHSFKLYTTNNGTSVESGRKITPVQIYYRPGEQHVYINCQSEIEYVNIYSINGNLIKTVNSSPTIDVNELSSGIYIIQTRSQEKSYYNKFVKY